MPPLTGTDGARSGIAPTTTFGVPGASTSGVGTIGTSNSGDGVLGRSGKEARARKRRKGA